MSKPATATDRQVILRNKKAHHKYAVIEIHEAGIVLLGCEVKSLRDKAVNFTDAYVRIQGDEAWLLGLHIKAYPNATTFTPDPDRKRKLLLHRSEIERLHKKATLAGLTIVPLSLYFKNGKAKVEIALARGKKLHDKRADLKARDAQREIDRHKR